MKAENVQRQHLRELRNTKDKPSPKLATDCPSPSRRLTARKSINPLKQGHTSTTFLPEVANDNKSDDTTVDADQNQSTAMDLDLQAGEVTNTTKTDTEVVFDSDQIISEQPSKQANASPSLADLTEEGGTEQELEEQDKNCSLSPEINKVWETIHRDLNSGGSDLEDDEDLDDNESKEEGEVDTLDEMLLEQHTPLVEQEEEPSDWEDREPNLADEDDVETAPVDSAPKKTIRECVLISSDDEAVTEHRKSLSADFSRNEDEDDERLELDTSSEVSETPSQKRVHEGEALTISEIMADLPAAELEDRQNSEDQEPVEKMAEEEEEPEEEQQLSDMIEIQPQEEEDQLQEQHLDEEREAQIEEEAEEQVEEDVEEEIDEEVEEVIEEVIEEIIEEEEVEEHVGKEGEEHAEEEGEEHVEEEGEEHVEEEGEEYVEEEVEEHFEEEVEEHFEEEAEEHFEEEVEEHFEEEVEKHVEDNVEEPFEKEVKEHVEDDVEEPFEEEVEDQVGEGVEKQQRDVEEQVGGGIEDEGKAVEKQVEGGVKEQEEEVEEQVEQVEEKQEEPVPMDISEVNAAEVEETTQSGDEGNEQNDPADLDTEQTVESGVEVEMTVGSDPFVDENVNEGQTGAKVGTSVETEEMDDEPGGREEDRADYVETGKNKAQVDKTNAEFMQVDADDSDTETANSCVLEQTVDINSLLARLDRSDVKSDTKVGEVDETSSKKKKLDEKSSKFEDLSNTSPELKENKLVNNVTTVSEKEVICLELNSSKSTEGELESEVATEEPSDDKDISATSEERSKTVEDDDLEVLEIKDGDNASKELFGSDVQKKEKTPPLEVKSTSNDAVDNHPEKEVEMIDLEMVDSGAESGSNSDVKPKDSDNSSAGKTVSSADAKNKTSSEVENSLKDKEAPTSKPSVVQSKHDDTPEIVVLDLENDSEVDQKEQDLKDKVLKEAGDVSRGKSVDSDVNVNEKSELADVCKTSKLSETTENDTDSLVRKRHLSQHSQNHINSTEQSKKPKLDLSEEPMEDALKQLDVLRMKEKKQNCTPTKVKLTKEVLEELINRRLHEHINNSQKSIIEELKSRCDGLEKAVDRWKKKAQALQNSVNELSTELQKHQRKPRGPTRTVGINVRISTNEPLRPLNSKPPLVLPKPPEPPAKANFSLVSTTQAGPVPMHLVPNLASPPNKTFTVPTVTASSTPQKQTISNTTLAGGATVKIIDLTHEDDEAAMKNVRPQPHIQAIPIQQNTVVGPNVVLNNALTRTTAPITLQTNTGGPLMQVPVTMQIIPSSSAAGGGVTLRGPRPTMNLPGNMAPPGSRVTTYLVPSGLPTMGSPRQFVPISGSPGVMQNAGTRPAPPMQTFLLRMNTVPTPASSTFTTLTTGSNVVSMTRGPPNVTLTSRNVITPATSVGQTTLLTSPRNVAPSLRPGNPANTVVIPIVQKHPAPFPQQLTYTPNPQFKGLPPKPALKISKVENGIVLSWNLTLNSAHAEIAKYQLYAYQEGTGPPLPTLWKKVGDVKALPLPMACTLTQFMEGNKYHFAICAVDKHNRCGPFSDPSSILLSEKELHR